MGAKEERPITSKGHYEQNHFNLGKVVYRAIETVLTRIATSPFSALGALFKGKGEELVRAVKLCATEGESPSGSAAKLPEFETKVKNGKV